MTMHRSNRHTPSILRTLRTAVAAGCIAALAACGDAGSGAPKSASESARPPATTPASDASPTNPSPATSTESAAAPDTSATSTPAAATPTASPTEIGPIFVTFVSKSGSIRVELLAKEAPRTCANFLNLARRGYYIGKPWDDFSPVVRQLGTAVDLKDLPYQLPREFSPKHLFDKGGLLCLANTTEDERARGHPCRIFLTVKPQERWNLVYPVFGRIVEGLDVAEVLIAGEPVAETRIEGDADALLSRYAKQVAEWNAILVKTPMP